MLLQTSDSTANAHRKSQLYKTYDPRGSTLLVREMQSSPPLAIRTEDATIGSGQFDIILFGVYGLLLSGGHSRFPAPFMTPPGYIVDFLRFDGLQDHACCCNIAADLTRA